MTGKELMYLEDALGHEQYLQTKCCEVEQALSDSTLKSTVADLQKQHRQLYNSFLNELS